MRLNLSTGAIVAAVALAALSVRSGERKYIAFGWEFNSITPDQILQHIDQLDASGVDGIGVYVNTKRPDGSTMSSRGIIHEPAWSRDDFASVIPKYRAITAHPSCRESFLCSYRAPRTRVAWEDDASWARIAHNMRTVAWLAKAGGFVGLELDPEDYFRQNQYVRIAGERPYAELAKLARQRGRETFAGVFAEHPTVKIISCWLLTMGRQYWGGSNLRQAMESSEDLWPHFVDGIFDALPPTATVIDGCENGYRFEADQFHFHKAATVMRTGLVDLLSPENRVKYRAQAQVSFGLYLDMYTNPEGNSYYFGPVDGSRLTHFERNLAAATEVADEYVWFWSEKHGFVHWADGVQRDKRLRGSPSWEEMLPGISDTIRVTKDPHGAVGKWRKAFAAGTLKAVNPFVTCDGPDSNRVVRAYSPWQEDAKYRKQQGTFGWDGTVGHGDTSSIYAEGVDKGCFTLYVKDLKPGSRYGLSFAAKGRSVTATVFWLRNGAWDWSFPGVSIPVEPDNGAWRQGGGSIRVPLGADGFGLQLGVHQAPGERTWFDDIAAYPIECK